MNEISLPIAHLQLLTDTPLAGLDPERLAAEIRPMFSFLPFEPEVRLEGERVVLRFAAGLDGAEATAARFTGQAVKKAMKGQYPRAIELYQRAVEVRPLDTAIRRDLAMCCMEAGRVDEAQDHLIDVLRLNPADTWGLVVLGNLFAKNRQDPETAAKFFLRALEVSPGDAWALNGLAFTEMKAGRPERALELFASASAAAPDFVHARCGKATVELVLGRPLDAAATLEHAFATGATADARDQNPLAEARGLYARSQQMLAESMESGAFKAVESLRRQIETESGYPVQVTTAPLRGIAGSARMAWKHGRDKHVIEIAAGPDGYPEILRSHITAHELLHIRMENAARLAGTNRWFTTNTATTSTAMASMEGEIQRVARNSRQAPDTIRDLTGKLVAGLCGFLYNCPLDVLIERTIREEFPALRPVQWLSLHRLAGIAAGPTLDPRIRAITPPAILRPVEALNGAMALFVDRLLPGADTCAVWRDRPGFRLARTIDALLRERLAETPAPGQEYAVVDELAGLLGLGGWFAWRADSGKATEENPSPVTEGVTNPELLRSREPATVMYLLDALRRYQDMDSNRVKAIAFEIGMLGQEGLDYTDPADRHTLRSLPGEKFTALQLMCLMYAGFKRIAPEQDTGMGFDDAWLRALELFQA